MPSLARDPKRGTWAIRWRDGGRQRMLRGFASKSQAATQAARIAAELAARQPLAPGALLTPADAVTRYLLLRAHTCEAHRNGLRRTMDALIANRQWTSWAKITPETCQGINPYQARCLRSILRWAADNGQPIHPRIIATTRPRTIRKPQAELPDPAAIEAAIATATTWSAADGAIAHLIATYGHRAESLVRLTVSAWDQARNTLDLRVKSGDHHRHPLRAATATILAPLTKDRKPDDPLFVGHLGRPYKSGQEWAAWWNHTAGKGLGVLQLRRHAISGMLALGLDARTVASITGHRTVSLLLNTYARTTQDRQLAAIAALDRAQDVRTNAVSH